MQIPCNFAERSKLVYPAFNFQSIEKYIMKNYQKLLGQYTMWKVQKFQFSCQKHQKFLPGKIIFTI